MTSPAESSSAFRLLLAAICIGGGFAGGVGIAAALRSGSPALELDSAGPDLRARVQPSALLKPDGVVEMQLNALRKSGDDPRAVADCFALASPANQAKTGPLERFAGMVGGPIFRPLVASQAFLVGEPVVEGDAAIVFVSVIDQAGTPSSYLFGLTRQKQPPYAGCWMTDAVWPAGVGAGRPGARPQKGQEATDAA